MIRICWEFKKFKQNYITYVNIDISLFIHLNLLLARNSILVTWKDLKNQISPFNLNTFKISTKFPQNSMRAKCVIPPFLQNNYQEDFILSQIVDSEIMRERLWFFFSIQHIKQDIENEIICLNFQLRLLFV